MSTKRMLSVTTLRKALLLYLALVIKGLPYDVVSCTTCRRPDGSYFVISFDGLHLGYRAKYKKGFIRTSVIIHPVPRASIVPRLITDEAISKAIGRVLSVRREAVGAASTITAMRGHVFGSSHG